MRRYKIRKRFLFNESWYVVYRRFLGFLWWYNFSGDLYRFKKDAIELIEKDRIKTNIIIVYD